MESKIIRNFQIISLSAIFAMTLFFPRIGLSGGNRVRVAILNNTSEFMISIRGKYRIMDPSTHHALLKGRRLRKSIVKPASRGIMINAREYEVDSLRIIPNKDVSIYTNKKRRRYRGQVDIIRDKTGKFLVINNVDLEFYVKGVLYHEVPHDWPLSAIQAQAVATRSYALYQLSVKKGKAYDVTSDIYSQVYGGRSAERHRANIAANRTRGQILTYQGKVLPAYFHSTCGGQTENAAELWGHDLKPLRGVKCGFCTLSPHYRWKKNFQLKKIQDQLNLYGYKIGLIKDIDVIKRTKSGRVKTLRITARDGKSVAISGPRFREIIGPNILKSNLYDIDMKGYYFDVIGRGWGHGVGMCQWGAYQMARQRYTYKEILEYYYPGSTVQKVSEL